MTNKPITVFGEVLFDHFPDGSCVLGGAPFNAAWHLQAFAQAPRFISRIGRDPLGDAIEAAMRAWGMAVSGLQRDSEHPTGSVQVMIDDGEPRYAILSVQAYDFIAADELAMEIHDGLLYHGTLAVRHEVSRQALDVLKARHRGKIFLDVNLRAPWWKKDDVRRLLDDADWVKLNHHELAELQPLSGDIKADMRAFQRTHDLEGLVVTYGDQGALAVDAAGNHVNVAPAPALQVLDTVGAGDAFAAVLLLGLNMGWNIKLTMERAQCFASALVGRRGATVQDIVFYQPFIEAWALNQ
jgi:fructokinase